MLKRKNSLFSGLFSCYNKQSKILNIAKNLYADRRRKIKSISSNTAISIAIEITLIAIERIKICESKIRFAVKNLSFLDIL